MQIIRYIGLSLPHKSVLKKDAIIFENKTHFCILNYMSLFFFFLILFIYLFMAVLGLCFCARAFSSCGKWGPLFIAVHGPFTIGLSCCGAQAPDAQAQQLWLTGLVAPRHVGSSQTRARTRVPCIGRQILNHCATREAPHVAFYPMFCENKNSMYGDRSSRSELRIRMH